MYQVSQSSPLQSNLPVVRELLHSLSTGETNSSFLSTLVCSAEFVTLLNSIWIAQTLKIIGFEPLYIFSKYPEEKTRLWNLVKLLDLVSWTLTFISIISAAIGLKFASYIGQYLGLGMENRELALNPFRCIFNYENMYIIESYSWRHSELSTTVRGQREVFNPISGGVENIC